MADSYEMRVKILSISDVQNVTESFKKRDVIGVIEGEYPEYHKFEFVQGKVDVPEDFVVGTYATVHFNIRGRKVEKDGENFYYTSLSGWKMEP